MDRTMITISLPSIETTFEYYLRPETKRFLDISFLFQDFNDDLLQMLMEDTGSEEKAKRIIKYYKPETKQVRFDSYLMAFIYGIPYSQLF